MSCEQMTDDFAGGGGRWIQTVTGGKFSFASPDPAHINLRDISLSLSRVSRFGGHTSSASGLSGYSVLQHSLHCASLVPKELRVHALLHDAHEAYVGDMTRDLQLFLGDVVPGFLDAWKKLKDDIDRAIGIRFGLNHNLFHHPLVKLADNRMLATEARDLMAPPPEPWTPLPEPAEWKISVMNPADVILGFCDLFEEAYQQSLFEEAPSATEEVPQ